ncbi:MAG: STAS domain-containing protein [Gammaproteobacteria bacterium]|jgi:ABC-type transporter Mla MlaB component|nr:STAS domain-containing protein [Gammaproteobacteria bacterium]MBT4075768.1 STAS domain-containing protein [Gammaproteobacteria bacterium]MBT4193937.1 STAS domain-containing protein [Gammaproteobacteria bacterium]MBT4451235.1 STAS domain-containing protein [Gammaproteobacteria bacterium]MBT4859859.1 STAS domain-containing protein [Gammaproteobacteria bacterium]
MSAIVLSGECTVYEIAQLHQQIHDNWTADTDLELDVSAVSVVDASFVQLLASCKKQAGKQALQFLLIKPTEALDEKIKAMFMNDFFSAETSDE